MSMASIADLGKYQANCFRALPERAQDLWFGYCESARALKRYHDLYFAVHVGFDYSECQSPIEVIFNLAFDLLTYTRHAPFSILTPQYAIYDEHKVKYYLDFCYHAADMLGEDSPNSTFRLAIECDGHEFHERTKEQVIHDNEKDYYLKMQGWDVLHFSGSEIYKSPEDCAFRAMKYIEEKGGI